MENGERKVIFPIVAYLVAEEREIKENIATIRHPNMVEKLATVTVPMYEKKIAPDSWQHSKKIATNINAKV